MRVALCSTASAGAFERGEITQLEWLVFCAQDLRVDGVVFDLAGFVRVDVDYLAQLKKLATDLAISIVAVRDDGLASTEPSAFDVASALGAPLVLGTAGRAGDDATAAYAAQLERLRDLTRTAKSCNVTIALRNAVGSVAHRPTELLQLAKEVDSAWLRFALDIDGPLAVVEQRVRTGVVLAYRLARSDQDEATIAAATLERLAPFPGFVCIDRAPGDETTDALGACRAWRREIAAVEVSHDPHVPS